MKKKTEKILLVSPGKAKQTRQEKNRRAEKIRKIKNRAEKGKRKLILKKPKRTGYDVIGNVTPDCTGKYFFSGEYNGHPYNKNSNGFCLWSNIQANASYIAAVLGDFTHGYWDYDDAGIEAYYSPHGDVLGFPCVTSED